MLETIWQQAASQSLLELIAVFAAIAYLVFAIREQIVCWLFAAISTSIYIFLFIEAKLYMESALNVVYLVMAGYGFWVWHFAQGSSSKRPVVVWPLRIHLLAGVVIIAVALLSGYLLSRFTDAAFPYVDSLTTCFAIWATFLVARKVLENWWYWLLIDLVSAYIFFARDLQLTAALFVVYIVMIPFGLHAWTRTYRQQASQ